MATINQVRAASQLTLHADYSTMLAKSSRSTKPVDQEIVREWLETFFQAARAMGVVPSALEQARNQSYGQAQAQPQEVKR